jgi:hypothetical protein
MGLGLGSDLPNPVQLLSNLPYNPVIHPFLSCVKNNIGTLRGHCHEQIRENTALISGCHNALCIGSSPESHSLINPHPGPTTD